MDTLILQAILHENRFDESELRIWANQEYGELVKLVEADPNSGIQLNGLTGGCK